MNDLFTVSKQRAEHIATGVVILAINDEWINGIQHVNCLVPQTDNGKDFYFANATYSIDELKLLR